MKTDIVRIVAGALAGFGGISFLFYLIGSWIKRTDAKEKDEDSFQR